jgi:hypothetical protein
MLSASGSKQPPTVQDVIKPNQPINLFQLQYAATGKMPFMSADDAVPQAGVTYIPPLNLKLQSKAPTKFRSVRDMSKANNLPESFSWSNDDDVRKCKIYYMYTSKYINIIKEEAKKIASSIYEFQITSLSLLVLIRFL